MRASKRFAGVGMLAALALIAFMIENLLPPLLAFAPGSKIGLASVFVTICLILYGERDAFLVLIAKCVLGSIFSGNMFSLYYSLPAGLVSLLVSIILYRLAFPRVSVLCVSVISAAFHNITQLLMAWALVGVAQVLLYVPVVILAGAIAGTLTGLCIYYAVRALPESLIYN